MDKSDALAGFAALSQETRLDAFRLLVKAGAGGMLAGQVAEEMGVRQNTMSTNLSVLLRAGLITNHREGRGIRYVANMEGLGELLSYLLQECCGGEPSLCAPLIESLTSPCNVELESKEKIA